MRPKRFMKIFAHDVMKLIADIHVATNDEKVTILTQTDRERALRTHFTEESVSGSGTREDPFEYCACDVTPYYAIIELWLMTCPLISSTAHTFFRVNDWTLETVRGGIISADGHFTKFY